jgi:hypothetical protein
MLHRVLLEKPFIVSVILRAVLIDQGTFSNQDNSESSIGI